VVELQFLRFIFAAVDAAALVTKYDMDLDPLREVTVVADSDLSRLAAGASLVLR